MVIEYAGNVIRSILTDKREKYYDGKVSSCRGACLAGSGRLSRWGCLCTLCLESTS